MILRFVKGRHKFCHITMLFLLADPFVNTYYNTAGKSHDVQSSYIKSRYVLPTNNSQLTISIYVSSISLDDIPSAPAPTALPAELQTPISPVSVLQNSPFYSPVRESPSHCASFTTFHPPQIRTSPEGSSCSDQDLQTDNERKGKRCPKKPLNPSLT